MKSKKWVAFLLILTLLLTVSFVFTACGKDEGEPAVDDDAYTLTLSGMIDAQGAPLADTDITKAQIKALFETKPVVYTDQNPCYASDKTDDQGNRIPHTVKGVYLEDILAEYTESTAIDEYGSLTLSATDNYVTVATEEVFNSAGRGSKMILAFEYDGVTLSEKEKSGALRAVFPDQIANCWAKKLKKIEFSTDILQTPAVSKFSVIEEIGDYTSYQGTATLGGEEKDCAYYGIPVARLIEEEILNAQSTDKMHCSAWDYDSQTNTSREYSAWTKYDVYSGGWLLYERQVSGFDKESLTRTPVFDGPAFSAGMTVKNILALSVYNTAVVSFETAFDRFDDEEEGEIFIKNILLLLNMYDEDNTYRVTSPGGQTKVLTAAEIWASTVTKEDGHYILNYNGGEIAVASVSIVI